MAAVEATHDAPFELDGRFVQGAGVIQGGVLAGILGEAVDRFAAAIVDAGDVVELETLDATIERPAHPGPFTVHASLIRHGRSLLAWETRLVDADGRTVASARTTHRIRTRRP